MAEIVTEHPQIVLINIASNSENPTEALLSNLAYAPFEFEGRMYTSVEAFWQGLKFPDEETRTKIATTHGIESKKVGNDAPKSKAFVYNEQTYRVGSPEHVKSPFFRT